MHVLFQQYSQEFQPYSSLHIHGLSYGAYCMAGNFGKDHQIKKYAGLLDVCTPMMFNVQIDKKITKFNVSAKVPAITMRCHRSSSVCLCCLRSTYLYALWCICMCDQYVWPTKHTICSVSGLA